MKKHFLVVGVMFLFVFSSVPVTFGYNVRKSNEEPIVKSVIFDSYHISEITINTHHTSFDDISNTDIVESNQIDILKEDLRLLDGPPMDSPWPMYCHDVRHTGRSPYSTAVNVGFDKWWFKCKYYVEGSAAIDKDGVIYFGGAEDDAKGTTIYFYALFPIGTLKWKCKIDWFISAAPTIAEDGTIYVGDRSYGGGKLYAINPNGTIKWKYHTYGELYSSPVIGYDGTIYVGDGDYYINAINPNGTLKWRYKTGLVVYSSPAIGDDGTVYCGSHDKYLYALYPNNGSLKWKYKLEDWVRTSPCIGDDGTIYVASLALHALYPNGTRKWKTNLGGSTSPTIGQDGTIYCGLFDLYALNPENGSIKWVYNAPGTIQGGTPCNAADGTIFFGTYDPYGSGWFIGLNPDGTERYRIHIGNCQFAPIIGEDGTVYIGNSVMEETGPGEFILVGYLYAFNKMDPNAPSAPVIEGPADGNPKIRYNYTFKSESPLGRDVYYYIDWNDGDWKKDWWLGPYGSGEEAVISHTWSKPGTYTIRTRCKDIDNLWSPWSEFEVSMPRNKATNNVLFWRLLARFPLLEILQYLLN